MGIMAQKKALSRIDFGHRACERLLHRMKTPLVSTGGRSVNPEALRRDQGEAPDAKASDRENRFTGKSMIVLVPDDIFEAVTDDELGSVISRTFGYPIQRRLRFGVDEEGDKSILHELSRIKREDAATNLLIVQEGWQPPIRENLLFIRDLRMASGGVFNDLGGSHRPAQTGRRLHPGERGGVEGMASETEGLGRSLLRAGEAGGRWWLI
jgi:hypothetical protein